MQRALALFAPFAFSFFLILSAGLTPALAQSSGASLFEKKCATCHGTDGSAKTSAQYSLHVADLRSKRIRAMSDTALFETIARGTSHREYQHAFLYTGLTQADIYAIVKWIRQLK